MVARVAIVLGTLAAAAAAPTAAGTPTCDAALRSVQCPGSAASHPACWDGAYTFERCCANPPSGDPTCWDGVNNFASCCTPSEQDCAVCAGHNQQALRNAGCTHEDIVGFCAGDAAPIAPTVEIAPGVAMPRINLGTCCGSEVTNAFPAWWAAGGRGVDTAYDYGKEVPGGKETDLRKAIDRVGAPRESLFITTKIRAGLDVLHGGKLCIGLNADYALAGVRADLAELNVSQVDLVLLHAPCLEDGTNAELWRGMEQALALNLTRAIGVSNYPKAQLGTLLETARVKPAVNQCQMSMANQEAEMVRYCKEHGIVFEAYEAMRACPFTNPQVKAIATRHGVGVSQVCLRWVLQQGAVFAVGLGENATEMAEYSKENLDLYSFELSAAEMTTLDGTGKEIGSCAQGY